jgi:WhiB family redox-sensing transcriptional regulator
MKSAGGDLVTVSVFESLGEAEESDELPCRLVDPEVFFAESPADVESAKALCQDCPVRAVCLAGALERREPWGVWGGELFVQGVVVARKRPRGRPRKHPLPEYAPVAKRSTDREEAAA